MLSIIESKKDYSLDELQVAYERYCNEHNLKDDYQRLEFLSTHDSTVISLSGVGKIIEYVSGGETQDAGI